MTAVRGGWYERLAAQGDQVVFAHRPLNSLGIYNQARRPEHGGDTPVGAIGRRAVVENGQRRGYFVEFPSFGEPADRSIVELVQVFHPSHHRFGTAEIPHGWVFAACRAGDCLQHA